MQDDLSRAQHYRTLALQMRDSADSETDQKRRQELLDIANQYEHLADKLIEKHVGREGGRAGACEA